jgi:hypothetical protein
MRHPLLRPATWQALFHPEDGMLFYQGRCPGYNAAVRRGLADDLVVVVLSNDYAAGMLEEVVTGIDALARGTAPPPARVHAAVRVAPASLSAFVGRYEPPAGALPLPPGTIVEVTLADGQLVVGAAGADFDVLVPQSERSFLARNLWSLLTFAEDGSTMTYRPLFRDGEFALRRLPPAR